MKTREEAINEILDEIGDALVICTTGKSSRELYELRISRGEEPHDFYMMGSMGHALSIGIGVARKTDKQVYVLGGDGEFMMKMGTVALIQKLRLKNLHYVILNNSAYESTGAQPSDFNHIRTIAHGVHNTRIVDVKCGSRDDLIRIPLSPKEITKNFYEKINS